VLEAAKTWALLDGSRVLITTRDTTFGDAALAPGKLAAHHELRGLAAPDALLLAAEILKNHGIDRERVPREGLERLMHRLGAHPLSLELVLPQLRRYAAEVLADEFNQRLAEFRRGRGETRNENLLVSLEMSLRRLSDEAREHLPDLAVFQGGALEKMILDIGYWDEAGWREVRAELQSAALLSAEDLPGVTVPFLRFHPTLLPYLAGDLPTERRTDLEARYRQAYHQLASYLYFADRQTPIQARAIAAREMPNLRRALDLTIAAGEVDAAADLADSLCSFLDVFGRWRERDQVLKQVARDKWQGTSGAGITMAEVTMLWRQGEALRGAGRAERVFRDPLARIEAGAAFDAGFQRAQVPGTLGGCLTAQGRPGKAIEAHRQALGAWTQLEQTDQARRAAGVEHTDLADTLRDLGRYAEARAEYEAALEIDRVLGDERGEAVDIEMLGTLALQQGQLGEAAAHYLEAMKVCRTIGEDRNQAIIWHQLGMVAQEAAQQGSGDWDEAERCYKESLALKERLGDKAGAASTCNQLAIVAQSAGRPAEAERWYRRAIELGEELNYVGELGKWYGNLAGLLLDQGRLDEAERYAHRAREIKETLDLSVQPWTTYALLARIAEQRGRTDEARAWRRKAEEAIRAFEEQSDGQWSVDGAQIAQQIKQWEPIIAAVVAACNDNVQAAQELTPFLDEMAGTEDWSQLIAALRRILAGEREETALTNGLDRVDTAIIRQVLAALVGPDPKGFPKPLGSEIDQLLALVARAAAGGHELGGQLFPALQQMARDPLLPPEQRALGGVLVHILAGNRQPDLSALPPDLATAVRAFLE
jgi:tetratricopeptide (TPR) repeat protein